MTIDFDMAMIGKLSMFYCVGLEFFVVFVLKYTMEFRDVMSLKTCLRFKTYNRFTVQ